MSRVYISYSREDEAFVRGLHNQLEANGIETWADWKDIPVGYPWREALFEGLVACDKILICLSRSFIESEMCQTEVFIARSYGKGLIPIVIDDCFGELLESNELRNMTDLQLIPFDSKRLIGLLLSDDELLNMLIEAAKGIYKPQPENSLYFAYPASDAAFATRIASDLKAAGFPSWIGTRDHNVGYDWQQEQWAAMMKARAFLIVLNENAALSPFIRRQVLFAHTRRLPILPIVAPETNFAAMTARFKDSWEMRVVGEIQWLKPEPSYEAMLEELKTIATKILSK